MESKLKALKVVELKDLLTRAEIPIPAKANKPDLIAKIIDSPAALDVFDEIHGGGSVRPSGANTPKPSVGQDVDVEMSKPAAKPQEKSDILAPPEPFDWSAGADAATDASTKPTPKPLTTTSVKPSSKREPAPTQIAETTTEETPKADAPVVEEDEEIKKRRARAERFGIPLVTPKQTQARKGPKLAPAVSNNSAAAATSNGTAKKTKEPKITKTVVEDPEKLKARAMKFGLPEKTKHVKPSSEAAARVTGQAKPSEVAKGITGQKRAAPEETLDSEEAERRRKRAERFGLPVKT
ncbi:hypothetical protein ACEPAH_7061 [Sanghuangporus vaninii]